LIAKWRIVIALIVIIISAYVLGSYYISYCDTKTTVDARYDELTAQPEPYTFQVPIYMTINNTDKIGMINETDIALLLEFTYPNETLVVNEPVFVNVTGLLDNAIENLDRITLVFPNSLVYPITYGDNHFPIQGIWSITNPYYFEWGSGNTYHNLYVSDTKTVIFPQEGDYSPIIRLVFKDNTNKTFYPDYINIHVYPKEQLKQYDTERASLVSSQASLKLSEAVFIISIVTVLALVFQILDHTESERKHTEPTTDPQDKQTCPKQKICHCFAQIRKKHK
jgi:hypothetical protein